MNTEMKMLRALMGEQITADVTQISADEQKAFLTKHVNALPRQTKIALLDSIVCAGERHNVLESGAGVVVLLDKLSPALLGDLYNSVVFSLCISYK